MSRAEAELIERDVIRDLNPRHNHQHTARDEFRDRRLADTA